MAPRRMPLSPPPFLFGHLTSTFFLLMLTTLIQPRSGVRVMRSQQRYRKLCRHGSGSIWRPLRLTIRMTAPQRRPLPPSVRRHDLRRVASGQAREGQRMRPVVPHSWLLRNTAPPALRRPGLRRVRGARMGRVRDRFADRPPRSCLQRTCSWTWPAPRGGSCGGGEGEQVAVTVLFAL